MCGRGDCAIRNGFIVDSLGLMFNGLRSGKVFYCSERLGEFGALHVGH